MEKIELQLAYEQCIEEIAQAQIDNKPTDDILQKVAKIQDAIRDFDIVEAVNRRKNSKYDRPFSEFVPLEQMQTPNGYHFNENGSLVKDQGPTK